MNYNCIFTGGSVRGLFYVGVLKAIEELGIEFDLRIGSSIGSLCLVFYTLGYSVEELENEINNLDLWKLFSDFNLNIFNDVAISSGKKYLKWLRHKIESKFYKANYQKGKMKPVCFKDIDKDIRIVATNLLTSELFVFSKETTPDVELAFAMRASSAMPTLMPAVKYEGKVLIDGDISRGRPIWKLMPDLLERETKILEFRMTGGNINKFSKNPISLLNSIVNVAAYVIDNDATQSYSGNEKFDIIQVDVPNTSFIDFALSKDKKQEIYKIGYETTINYFKSLNG